MRFLAAGCPLLVALLRKNASDPARPGPGAAPASQAATAVCGAAKTARPRKLLILAVLGYIFFRGGVRHASRRLRGLPRGLPGRGAALSLRQLVLVPFGMLRVCASTRRDPSRLRLLPRVPAASRVTRARLASVLQAASPLALCTEHGHCAIIQQARASLVVEITLSLTPSLRRTTLAAITACSHLALAPKCGANCSSSSPQPRPSASSLKH